MRAFGWGNGDCSGSSSGSSSSSSNSGGASVGTNAHTERGGREGWKASSRTDAPAAGRSNVPAAAPSKPAAPAPCRLLVSVGDEDDGDTARWLNHNAVECQRVRAAMDG